MRRVFRGRAKHHAERKFLWAMPLRDIRPVRFAPAPAAGPGIYAYYFGADGRANGLIDFAILVFDDVTVHIR